MTDVERRLWQALRQKQFGGCRFRRQAPIGPFIVDFVCFERKIVVELDGSQHACNREQDALRTRWLNTQGFRVLRFWNHEVFEEWDGMLEAIALAVQNPPHPSPPPQGGRGPDGPSHARGEGPVLPSSTRGKGPDLPS